MACSPVLPRLLRRRATSLTSMSMETGRELIPQALHGRRGVGANASAEPAPASSTSERRREGISLANPSHSALLLFVAAFVCRPSRDAEG